MNSSIITPKQQPPLPITTSSSNSSRDIRCSLSIRVPTPVAAAPTTKHPAPAAAPAKETTTNDRQQSSDNRQTTAGVRPSHLVELMRLIISMCPKSISYPSMNMYTSFHTYLCRRRGSRHEAQGRAGQTGRHLNNRRSEPYIGNPRLAANTTLISTDRRAPFWNGPCRWSAASVNSMHA